MLYEGVPKGKQDNHESSDRCPQSSYEKGAVSNREQAEDRRLNRLAVPQHSESMDDQTGAGNHAQKQKSDPRPTASEC
jgi:hypothetical protein